MKRSVPTGGLAPILMLALALTGCGETPFDPEEIVPEGGDVQIQPGLYRSEITIGGTGGGAGTGGRAATSQYGENTICFSPEDVAGGNREMLLAMQGRDSCRFESYDLSGDRLEAVMICKGGEFQPETEARISGTVTPTASDLQMTVAGFEDAEGEPTGGIAMRVTNERIGECPDGAQ